MDRAALLLVARSWPGRWLARLVERDGLTVLVYHQIAEDEGLLFRGLDITVTSGAFRQHMWFLRSKLRVAPLDEALELTMTRRGHGRVVVVTFDDGYRSVLDQALPHLLAAEVPAAVFVCPAYVGNTRVPLPYLVRFAAAEFGPERVARVAAESLGRRIDLAEMEMLTTTAHRRTEHDEVKQHLLSTLGVDEAALAGELRLFLTWPEIAELRAAGLTIGNHSLTHPVLATLTLDEQRVEVEEAKQAIIQRFDCGPVPFAFPYGRPKHYSPGTVRIVAESGHSCALAVGGSNAWGTSPFQLERTLVTAKVSFEMNVEVLPALERLRGAVRDRVASVTNRFR
jgi:peptidoglycan/xylan/chitin deacetylase (PgdA/CDA1 family)